VTGSAAAPLGRAPVLLGLAHCREQATADSDSEPAPRPAARHSSGLSGGSSSDSELAAGWGRCAAAETGLLIAAQCDGTAGKYCAAGSSGTHFLRLVGQHFSLIAPPGVRDSLIAPRVLAYCGTGTAYRSAGARLSRRWDSLFAARSGRGSLIAVLIAAPGLAPCGRVGTGLAWS
jgi:hypothetical protein